MSNEQKQLVEDLKIQWKMLWRERLDDKVRAEGVAINNYGQLFVDKGTIIHATRDFKTLNFKDILNEYEILNPDRYIAPNPEVGGWAKFVKKNITNQNLRKEQEQPIFEKKQKNQLKKKGRGWLHC